MKLADIVQLPGRNYKSWNLMFQIIPGGYNPLPGRTSFGDYWPLMPMSNQYHAAVTYDTAKGRVGLLYRVDEVDMKSFLARRRGNPSSCSLLV